MQRVVRLSFIGLLAMAGLTACGDKVEVSGPTTQPPSLVVRSVTVTPSSATLNQGDKITLAASVNADAGVTDRTVTWRSGNTAIASVDANGVVTAGTTAGTTTITALAKADTTVRGAAVITVNAAQGGGGGAPATVTVSSINQTTAAGSVPANLGNVAGQLDVTLNVDPGAQRLVGVDLVFNCTGNGNSGQDTVVATQTLASTNVVDAAAASAPVTLSFNTASFNGTTGAVAFRNGACTIKGRARTNSAPGGAITTVTSTSQNITLNNTDVVIGSLTSTKSAIHPTSGLVWNGGDVTITSTPVFYSGRVPATTVVTFECRNVTLTGTGTQTATFVDANDAPAVPAPCGTGVLPTTGNATPAANDIDGITDANATATFTLVDQAGQQFTNPVVVAGVGCGANTFCTSGSVLAGSLRPVATIRLDTQAPPAGNFFLASNTLQNTAANGFLGANFRFAADSAAGFRGPNANAALGAVNCAGAGATNPVTCNLDNNGVDNVTVVFLSATSVTGTFAALTNVSALSETNTPTGRTAIMITTDALGNADTSFIANAGVPQAFRTGLFNGAVPNNQTRFGVDKTPPTITQIAGPSNQAVSQTLLGTGQIVDSISDAISGPAPQQLVAQVRQQAGLTANSTLPANGTIFTNGTEGLASNAGCVVGQFFTSSTAAGPNALPVLLNDGTTAGFCAPTPFTMNTVGNGRGIFANEGGQPAYVTTRIIAIDQAGNTAAPQTIIVAEDNALPTVAAAIDAPLTISGGSSVTFGGRAGDNLDLAGSFVQINYNAAASINMTLQYPVVTGPGAAFDNVLTTSTTTVSPTVPFFLRNLQQAALGQPANPGGNNSGANTVAVGAFDAANNTRLNTPVAIGTLATVTQPGSTNPWASQFAGGFTVQSSNANVSDCPTAGCAAGGPVNPTSTVLTAIAAGTTGTFNNPFNRVQFWYQTGTSPWFFIGESTSAISNDTGAGNGRTWAYSLTWTPPKTTPVDVTANGPITLATPGGTVVVNVRAIGATSSGDGLATASVAINLTNP